jgi:hydroxymethylpyrimidine/phosphomethylpyrimidine kinase
MMDGEYVRVLTVAGSDSGGGAGIQADLKTFSALGCYGMSVITALTAQNTTGVRAIHPVPPDFVEEQLEAVLSDMGAAAVKIGMLYSRELIRAVAGQLVKHRVRNIVLDPVMVAQSGDSLLQDEAVSALKEVLFPLATVVTPNLHEVSILVGRQVRTVDDMDLAARELGALGAQGVLIKGGHLPGRESTDLLYLPAENRAVIFKAERVDTRNNHGTGCTLSSGIASFLARGESLDAAASKAKDYLTRALRAGAAYRLGKGHGPVHHFFQFW